MSGGENAKARDILAAIRILNQLDAELRPDATEVPRLLGRFPAFGPGALSDSGPNWQALGEEPTALLSPEDYDSAKRTTF
jgi:hypothetical protein